MYEYLVFFVIASFIPQVEVRSHTSSLVSGEIIHVYYAPWPVHKTVYVNY